MSKLLDEATRRWEQEEAAASKFDPPSEENKNGVEHVLTELAALSPIEYDRRRQKAAEELGVRMSTLDKMVSGIRTETEAGEDNGGVVLFEEPEPWPDPVDGAALLADLARTFRRFVIMPKGADTAAALWVLHTWTHDAARISPILALSSPEKRCGKTTFLSLLQVLVKRPLPASNITAAALFRATEKWRPTLLIDEADTFLKNSDELRGIINSGHTRSAAFVIRTVGDDHEPRTFRTWAPKAVALIGRLPSTLADRAVVIPMRRKTTEEKAERLRLDRMAEFDDLPRRCARWAADNLARLTAADPETPTGLNDRAADNWRPLLAISEAAGADWPTRTRNAILELTQDDDADEAAGVMLLGDIQTVFEDKDRLRLTSSELVEALVEMEDRPWPEWYHGKPITTRQIARLLKPFDIKPDTIRIGSETAKGYLLKSFGDAFKRYLPGIRSVTPSQPSNDAACGDFRSVTRNSGVTDEEARKSLSDKNCYGVTDENRETWEKYEV